MTKPIDYKKFQSILSEYSPDKSVTDEEAAAAFHNLAEFVLLLMEINDSTGFVKFDEPKRPI